MSLYIFPGILEPETSSINRVNYKLINRKCSCEIKVRREKLAEKESSEKVALAKKELSLQRRDSQKATYPKRAVLQ